MKLRRAAFAALAATIGIALLLSCSRKKEESPVDKDERPPSVLKSGLKLTTFPNNKFTGPGEIKSEAATLGFPCDQNPYNGKEVSLRYEGYLKVDQDGKYEFQIRSDDQSRMKVDSLVIEPGSTQTKSGSAMLKVGTYPLTLDYQNNVGPACLVVKWSADDGRTFSEIPASQLFHD